MPTCISRHSAKVGLFADDTVTLGYLRVATPADAADLQRDLDALQK